MNTAPDFGHKNKLARKAQHTSLFCSTVFSLALFCYLIVEMLFNNKTKHFQLKDCVKIAQLLEEVAKSITKPIM